jgi:hypothetical protein
VAAIGRNESNNDTSGLPDLKEFGLPEDLQERIAEVPLKP